MHNCRHFLLFALPLLLPEGAAGQRQRSIALQEVGTNDDPPWGAEGSKNEFPFLLNLVIEFSNQRSTMKCAGVLLSKEWVLTAAHCLFRGEGDKASKVTVGFGNHDKEIFNEPGEFYKSQLLNEGENAFIHPDFNRTGYFTFDMAMILLNQPVCPCMAQSASPVVLPPASFCTQKYSARTADVDSCSNALTLGWSVTKNGAASKTLRKANIAVRLFQFCLTDRNNVARGPFSADKLCLGGGDSDDEHDVCPGDQGGPVLCIESGASDTPYLLGITSYGNEDCGGDNGDRPEVYARICAVLPWINDHLTGNYLSTTAAAPKTTTKEESGSTVRSNRCETALVPGDDFGSCGSAFRYYYNKANRRCMQFLGCDNSNENSNNFGSKAECIRTCVKVTTFSKFTTPTPEPPPENHCSAYLRLGIDFGGDCEAVPRFSYNAILHRCTSFLGCRKPVVNLGNNFVSLAECHNTCEKAQASNEVKTTTAGQQSVSRCDLLPKRGIDFGVCLGNKLLTRFYWSNMQSKCISYPGCVNRNGNNWDSVEECILNCGNPDSSTTRLATLPDRCKQTVIRGRDFGNCGLGVSRFTYNAVLNTCVRYLGCPTPNEGNNFESLEECQRYCISNLPKTTTSLPKTTTPKPCLQALKKDVDYGSCGSSNRYYYSTRVGRCVRFLGCQNPDSNNNFDSLQECEKTCSSDTPPAQSSSAVSPRCLTRPRKRVDYGACPGDNTLTRYYWSKYLSICLTFEGCENPNGNNFDTATECAMNCELQLY